MSIKIIKKGKNETVRSGETVITESSGEKSLDLQPTSMIKNAQPTSLQRLKKTLLSGRGQEQSALDKLIDHIEELNFRISRLEKQNS